MSSRPGERFGIRVLGIHLDSGRESLLLDFHTWKKNISWCPHVLTWCERGMGQRWTVPMELSLGWVSGQIFLSASWVSSGLHREQEGGTQGRACRASSGDGSRACSAEHPHSLLQPPPLLTTLYIDLCAHGCRTYRNQFTGKQGKAGNLTTRWPVSHVIVLCCLLSRLWR